MAIIILWYMFNMVGISYILDLVGVLGNWIKEGEW